MRCASMRRATGSHSVSIQAIPKGRRSSLHVRVHVVPSVTSDVNHGCTECRSRATQGLASCEIHDATNDNSHTHRRRSWNIGHGASPTRFAWFSLMFRARSCMRIAECDDSFDAGTSPFMTRARPHSIHPHVCFTCQRSVGSRRY
jgi:hypothetical protein